MKKYPFTPELLDALPEELAGLYRALEETLLDEICSRLKLTGQLNEVTVQDIKALRSHGIELTDIEKAIQKTTGIGEKQLDELLTDVVLRNQQYYTQLLTLSNVTQPDVLVRTTTVDAIRQQTMNTFRNLTASMGFLVDAGRTMLPPAKAYHWALDNAVLQIQSGAVSYSQAIRSAVRQLAQSGLKSADYASGHVDQIDVAARRAVMTGVSQICAQYTEQSAAYLDTPYFEISAHSGARDKPGPSPWSSHKSWQGRVYSTRSGDIYPNIYEVCGLGYVDGLEGANCRHRRFPFVEGVSERTYTDAQLAHIDDGLGCTFDGVKYTAYEATQMQRKLERTIRKVRREKKAYQAAGLTEDATATGVRLRRLNGKYAEFSQAAGLPTQKERLKVLYTDENSTAAAEAQKEQLKYVSKVPTSVSTLVSQSTPTQPTASAPESARTIPVAPYIDVTEQWQKEATPNSHVVQDLQAYTKGGVTYHVDGHNVVLDYSPHEKEIAELLEKEFGGEMYLVPRVNNPQGVSTPDFLFRGRGYDLKTIGEGATNDTVFNRIKKAKKQARRFVVEIAATNLTDEMLSAQMKKVFSHKDTFFVDELVLIKDGKIQRVIKRA